MDPMEVLFVVEITLGFISLLTIIFFFLVILLKLRIRILWPQDLGGDPIDE
jgi:hypothetical protein